MCQLALAKGVVRKFDVIVVGAGHAGCEAAAAAARLGATTALVSRQADDIGTLSCNPAIGGLGKGHLVREVDALDGLIGRVADIAALQFRLLNRSRGAAVQGPRAQVDRRRYASAMRAAIADQESLTVIAADVCDLILADDGRVVGISTNLGAIMASSIVLTTGTFLAATLHQGTIATAGGRIGAPASVMLARAIARLDLPRARFKTGTPPRLDGRTIDWAMLAMQAGDAEPVRLSSAPSMGSTLPQISCAITATTEQTHEIIRENISLAPKYAGSITGVGPRYCPSIEDKVVRFGDRTGHQIYLEPEGYDNHVVYPNGISTAMPSEIQQRLVNSIPGLGRARILRPGYAVEYDHVDPRSLLPTLAVRDRPGLFLAGQINGTTGYEEAAGQGIVAGINAARAAGGQAGVVLDRASSYIGVMIDDLVTQGVTEPYRMFTSRAEFRLSLRIDNADERLTPTGIEIGVVGRERRDHYSARYTELTSARASVARLRATPAQCARADIAVNQDGVARSAASWLATPAVDWRAACRVWPELRSVAPSVAATVETDMRYAFYLERQAGEVAGFRRDESLILPETLDFSTIAGLSPEMIERLSLVRPTTFGAATRVAGVTPGAMVSLLAHVRRSAG